MRITTAAAAFVLSALLAWRFGTAPELAAYVLLAFAGVQLARIDLIHHLLPNRLVLPLLGAGLVLLAGAEVAHGTSENLLRAVAGASILFVLYLFLALTSRNGLGMGDVKLAAPLGLYLGYLGWSHLFYGGALGFVAGGVASVLLVLKNRGNKPKEVPFGPSMLAAGLAVILLLP
jgi:leader peptidase (prepilin peptidase)/N-methyltransferase